MATTSNRKRRIRRLVGGTLLTIVLGAIILPMAFWTAAQVMPETFAYESAQNNPRSNYWREVREGTPGYSAVKGQERGVLIENGGENWRQIRNGWVANFGPWVLALMLGAIAAFYLWRGRIEVTEKPSGRTVPRWSLPERVLHWYTAILFIVLAITGLSLLFGRAVLIPLLGHHGFSAYAQLAMYTHNYIGPFFSIGVLLIIIAWFRYNIPDRTDWEWFKKRGGMVGDEHPHAGRMNAGEKAWFWIITTAGVAVIASGFVLDFPNFEQTRPTMQAANIVHSVLAILWIAVSLGHIYIGTLGTEGAIRGMTSGRVSSEWARQHHDLWYEEVKHLEETTDPPPAAGAPKPVQPERRST